MTYSHISADNSSTSQILEHVQLYGYRPSQDEPDPRPMPSDETIAKAVEDIFDILSVAFGDSGLESDLNNVLWGTVNQFHHTAGRVARELDRNEQAQRSAQNEQDGSEVKSVELERLIAYGRFLSERRDALETFRDLAASAFDDHPADGVRLKPERRRLRGLLGVTNSRAAVRSSIAASNGSNDSAADFAAR